MAADGVFELIVDLAGPRLVSVTERADAEPSITMTELESLRLVLANPEFAVGLQERGITDLDKVFCAPFSAGYYGDRAHVGKRLVKVGCFDTRRSTTNLFGWPIEGLYALVDLRKREVMNVTDQGVVPIAPDDHNYTETAVGSCASLATPPFWHSRAGRTSRSTVTRSAGATGGSMRAWIRASARSSRWPDGKTLVGPGQSSIRATCRRCSCPTWTRTMAGSRAPTSTRVNTAPARWRHP
jgi:hypothetical protein